MGPSLREERLMVMAYMALCELRDCGNEPEFLTTSRLHLQSQLDPQAGSGRVGESARPPARRLRLPGFFSNRSNRGGRTTEEPRKPRRPLEGQPPTAPR